MLFEQPTHVTLKIQIKQQKNSYLLTDYMSATTEILYRTKGKANSDNQFNYEVKSYLTLESLHRLFLAKIRMVVKLSETHYLRFNDPN